MKQKPSYSAGFSLVEVAVALAVVVICLVALFGLLALGVTQIHTSTEQTVVPNVMSAIVADLQSAPNPAPKGTTATQSLVYGITLPPNGAANSTTPAVSYIGEDGQPSTKANARYQLNVWTIAPTATKQETVVRLLVSWPAQAAYTNAQGSVESIIALDRN